MDLILFAIVVLLFAVTLVAHRRHAGAIEEIKGMIASTRREIAKLKGGKP